jgi:quercetin dioxygenase-like cupin family protein
MNRLTLFTMLLLAAVAMSVAADPPGVTVETLLDTDETILGQPFAYPEGTARITAAVLTVPPHARIDLHQHPVPLFVHILQGSITVEYENIGPITYEAGDSFVEAYEWPHRARNSGRGLVKILTVYAGAEGVPNAEPLP